MKKFLLALLILGCASFASAEMNPVRLPAYNQSVSPVVFFSTATNTETPISLVVISSYPTLLHTVNVTSGGFNSTLEIWDSKVSTTASGIRKIATIDTSIAKERAWLFDVYLDSGMSIFNRGATPAHVNISFRQR